MISILESIKRQDTLIQDDENIFNSMGTQKQEKTEMK